MSRGRQHTCGGSWLQGSQRPGWGEGGTGGGRWQSRRLVTQRKINQISKYIKDNGSSFLTIRKGSYNYEKGQN